MVLEDLEHDDCTFGECTRPWEVTRVAAGLAQLAALHARTWGARAGDSPWLSEGFSMWQVVEAMMGEGEWEMRFGGGEGEVLPPPVPRYLVDRERVLAAFRTLWREADPRLRCVVHGDPHVGNTFVTAAGEPGFLDFQGPHAGSAMHDVAYFLVGALPVEDRREHERGLVQGYLRALSAAGGPELTVDDVWTDYRRHRLHGFVWPLSGPMMQTTERVHAMSLRHCAAIEDHKSLELLEAGR